MRKLIIPVLVILVGVFFSSVYVVEEGSRGVVLRFNKINALSEPGLHFKIPGMDNVRIIDAKIQTTDSSNNQNSQFITLEKKGLIVDYYVQWKITDFSRYYEAIAGGYSVENLLLARLNGRLRAEIGKLEITDIINDSNDDTKSRNSLMVDVKDALNGKVKGAVINDDIPLDDAAALDESKTSMRAFGVEVIDVRIKQINFPPEVSESIYARMSAEREVVAREQRYQGIREAEETRAKANLTATQILSEAERRSRITRGEGDASAAKLYADAFGKDKEFFSFIRSLKAYEQSFSSDDIMVISPDSEFFRYMKLSGTK
ncbi:protease modulator HflC [Zophobihabitans entericus]|uniref:Protein HflC n=1 Tax=Zophobihabitans entericus TaxID=1635327 RepID=A0A6G9I8H7_9GAMM|nr:protease modulator HflC [Zophobihabitans entericus]QIQ20515.1 protease modulator HflC [Zophobihabitans entericus]